jgi:hypothetical protein
MKFKVGTASSFYKREDKEKLEKLGFVFDKSKGFNITEFYKDYDQNVEIEIESLEELMEFVNKWGDIVLSEDGITIYDGYLE